jgi:hypothetical protein
LQDLPADPEPWQDPALTIDEKLACLETSTTLSQHTRSAIAWDLIMADIAAQQQPGT